VKLSLVFLNLVLFIIVTGCGNVFPNRIEYAPQGSYNIPALADSSASSAATTDPENYDCPSGSNIFPQFANSSDGSEYYQVCPSNQTGNVTDILVHGKTVNTQMICIFPAQQGPSGNPTWIGDPNKGGPLYQCAPTTEDGAFFTFATGQVQGGFNAAFIVEGSNELSMKQCLMSRYSYCPSYSYGKFR